MSYDIYLQAEACNHCGRGEDRERGPNPTYNLTPIFDLALTGEALPNPEVGEAAVVLFRENTDRPRGLRVLSGRKAADTVADITAALERLKDPLLRNAFVALEPENGWGDIAGAVSTFDRLMRMAEDWPSYTWEIR